jgi:hypothetical protein
MRLAASTSPNSTSASTSPPAHSAWAVELAVQDVLCGSTFFAFHVFLLIPISGMISVTERESHGVTEDGLPTLLP